MSAQMTSVSLQYRRRAAKAGRQAIESDDDAQMLRLLHQALSWIQLAENEEMMSHGPPLAGLARN